MKIIFLIDDDIDDREIFQDALGYLGKDFVYLEAIDGQDALLKLKNNVSVPDVIFLDLNMPRMDGHEFLDEFIKVDRYKKIPVIIYSTSPSAFNSDLNVTNRITGSLKKQSSIQALRTELNRSLQIL